MKHVTPAAARWARTTAVGLALCAGFLSATSVHASGIGPVTVPLGPVTTATGWPAAIPQQLIVRMAPQSRSAGIKSELKATAVADRVTAFASARGYDLKWTRRLATGHDVFEVAVGTSPTSLKSLASALATSPGVISAEPDVWMRPMLVPNDEFYTLQWHYFEPTAGINLPLAWDTATGAGVTVAVLDTGLRLVHPDAPVNLKPGYDFISNVFVGNDGNARDADASDPGDFTEAGACGNNMPAQFQASSFHGSHTTGTVAAATNNGIGVAGVAFNANVVPVRVLGRCGGSAADISDGIIWAAGGTVAGVPANANPAKVLSMSLGGGGTCPSFYQDAITSARARGATVVVAAGNENQNVQNVTPANCSGVVTVAALARGGGKASYSNFGTLVDIAAPGGDFSERGQAADGVASLGNMSERAPTNAQDSYKYEQGTSMATPHVAGVVALMLQKFPTLTPDQVEAKLKSTARAFPTPCTGGCGAGVVDALAAIGAGGTDPGTGKLTKGVKVSFGALAVGAQRRFSIDVPAGASNFVATLTGTSGDADLYVRIGEPPTLSVFDCRPFLGDSNEQCTLSGVVPQNTYHFLVDAASAATGLAIVASYDGGVAPPPTIDAKADAFTINEDAANSALTVLKNDVGLTTAATITAVTAAQHGTVTINAAKRALVYTPKANYNGTDTFQYTVKDGAQVDMAMVTVTIKAVNDAPIARNDSAMTTKNAVFKTIPVKANDTDADVGDTKTIISVTKPLHGLTKIVNGVVQYRPVANFAGNDSFKYTIQDSGGLTSTATVSVMVATVVNPPPSLR